jgi:dethiobiotin synthetase
VTRGYFITGTDTGVGKTYAAQALIAAFAQQGLRVAGMKPVATGCAVTPEGLRNDDALALQRVSNVRIPYELCNPYAFEPPIAPHIAAQHAGRAIDLTHIAGCYTEIAARCDVVVVEGVGGWLVPLNQQATVADLARALQSPVILVVGLRLGCLNHAALTSKAITDTGAPFAGWIANHVVEHFDAAAENLATLRQLVRAPHLGTISWASTCDPDVAARELTNIPLQDA